jgi:TonB family protein
VSDAVHPIAAQSLLASKPSRMTPFFFFSAGMHAGIVVVGAILSWVLATPPIDLDQKPIIASLVRQGKKRDEKLLPRKEEAPPPEEEKVLIPTPDVKTPPPKPTAKAEKPPDKRKSLFDALNKASKADDPEGEENGDPKGDSAKQEGERYYGIIKSAVRRFYDVTNTIAESERIRLSADVIIRLDAEGGLIDVRLAKPSDNAQFNEAVITAVKKAAPFGPPPPALKGPLKKDGVQLRFTP